MDNENITRREAIKKMGIAAAGIGLGIGGANAFDVLRKDYKERSMKVLLVNGRMRGLWLVFKNWTLFYARYRKRVF